jgi:bifunctional non-homologous end joining protein LigD
MDHPTLIAFDLDPGPPATIVECARVALDLRTAFEHLGMQAFPKTSGSKGMQVYLPLNTPVTYADTREFSHGLARLLERPTVSTPLSWDEVERIAETGVGLAFTADEVLTRVAELGDLFAPVQTLEQTLPR